MMLHNPAAPLKMILESGIVRTWAWLGLCYTVIRRGRSLVKMPSHSQQAAHRQCTPLPAQTTLSHPPHPHFVYTTSALEAPPGSFRQPSTAPKTNDTNFINSISARSNRTQPRAEVCVGGWVGWGGEEEIMPVRMEGTQVCIERGGGGLTGLDQ